MEINREFLFRVLCDDRPTKVEALYLVAQSDHNQYSVIDQGFEAFEQGLTEHIVILGSDPISGYPGSGLWRTILMTRGVPPEAIHETDGKEYETLNTYEESQLFVNFCTKHDLKNVGICAAPFHQERAYISVVSAAIKANLDLNIYSYLGKPLTWNEKTRHSQGTQEGTRLEILEAENKKIKEYQKKGDLLSKKEILDYMNSR